MVALSDSSLNVAWNCTSPYQLTKTSTNSVTGETSSVTYLKRCGSRLKSKYVSCSELYKRDARELVETGIFEKNKKSRTLTFITLTAPSSKYFGKTHYGKLKFNQSARACECSVKGEKRIYHNFKDPLIGTAINPETYNYVAAAQFNANVSRLYAVVCQNLTRIVGHRLEILKVTEYQVRGLCHIHAVAIGEISQAQLKLAICGGINTKTGRKILPTKSHGWSFGPQCKADIIFNTAGSEKVLGYVLKYALKSATSDKPQTHAHSEAMATASKHTVGCSIIKCEGVCCRFG